MDDLILEVALLLVFDFWLDLFKFGELGAEFDFDFDFWLDVSCLTMKLNPFELLIEEIDALLFDRVPYCLSLRPFLDCELSL